MIGSPPLWNALFRGMQPHAHAHTIPAREKAVAAIVFPIIACEEKCPDVFSRRKLSAPMTVPYRRSSARTGKDENHHSR